MTHSTAPEEAAIHLSPQEKLEILGAILLALFLFALDQTVVGHGAAAHRHRPPRQRPVHVGRHDLPADLDDQRPDLRQAVRPVRPPADHHLRGQPVHRRLGPVRPEPGDVAVHPVPRPPGSRRRRGLPGRARGHRRPVHARPSAASTWASSARCSGCRRSSGRASAASSPTPSAGTGSSSSTCPIGPRLAVHHAGGCCRRSSARTPAAHIDYVGAALFTRGDRAVPRRPDQQDAPVDDWTDPSVGGLILARPRVRRVFLWVESRVAEPIVPLDLFRIRTFTISVAAMFLAAFGFFAAIDLPAALVPDRRAATSATESGYNLLPLLAGAHRQRDRSRARSWPGPAATSC